MKLTKDQKFRLTRARKETISLLARIDEIYEAFHQEFSLDEENMTKIGRLNDYLVGYDVTLKELERAL